MGISIIDNESLSRLFFLPLEKQKKIIMEMNNRLSNVMKDNNELRLLYSSGSDDDNKNTGNE
jgi:hypothetical protein